VLSRLCAAVPPIAKMTFGLTSSSCRYRKRQARRDLVVLRQPVLWGPAFHDVADEHLIPRQLDASRILVSSSPARPTNGRPVSSSVRSRSFANDHEPRRCGALARDGVRAAIAQLALATGRDERRDVLDAGGLLDGVGGRTDLGLADRTKYRGLGLGLGARGFLRVCTEWSRNKS